MSMQSDAPISSLLRVHRGTAEPEELAAIAVVVACLVGRASHAAGEARGPARPARAPRHRHQAPRAHGCWAGCWACG
ncbi:acyl-CoA carboxylase subunit epsilon [Streptomyces sp. NPDC098789]|uniref:acyl-CoA carboxylase subunit epsilon n=1 Tax=Streptomyces sp. NPDC098789 TaxID=3366098 RepID=UPI0037F20313